MKNLLILLASLIVVTGCATGRKDPAERVVVQEKLIFREIPDEYLVCNPPPVTADEVINMTEFENDYNERAVLPLFRNNEECYLNIERIREWNMFNKIMNSVDTPEDSI